MARKTKSWSWVAGAHGAKVKVFERTPGGPLSVGVPLPKGGYNRVSLGHKRNAPKEDFKTHHCVCFTETPPEHLHLLLREIEDMKRDCHFGPYGIAVTKLVARRTGINPAWYIDPAREITIG
jgi:hypothetical protein